MTQDTPSADRNTPGEPEEFSKYVEALQRRRGFRPVDGLFSTLEAQYDDVEDYERHLRDQRS